jgi:hypothetical protein
MFVEGHKTHLLIILLVEYFAGLLLLKGEMALRAPAKLSYHTSKCPDVVADPFQSHPLIFEAKVSLYPGLVTGKKPEHGKTVANIDPDLGTFGSYVLSLVLQTMWGAELEETTSQPCRLVSSLVIG